MTDRFQNTGQRIQGNQFQDCRFDADRISFVSHIDNGTGGKKCPGCGGGPMQKTSLVWQLNSSHGRPKNELGRMAVPPMRACYLTDKPTTILIWLVNTAVVIALIGACGGIAQGGYVLILLALVLIAGGIAMFLKTRARERRRQSAGDQWYAQHLGVWNVSWICTQHCGRMWVIRPSQQ